MNSKCLTHISNRRQIEKNVNNEMIQITQKYNKTLNNKIPYVGCSILTYKI